MEKEPLRYASKELFDLNGNPALLVAMQTWRDVALMLDVGNDPEMMSFTRAGPVAMKIETLREIANGLLALADQIEETTSPDGEGFEQLFPGQFIRPDKAPKPDRTPRPPIDF